MKRSSPHSSICRRSWLCLRSVGAAGLMLLVAACGEPYRGEPLYGPLTQVVGTTSDASGERLLEGRVHFDRLCDQCHPGGAGGMAPAINNKPLPAWLLRLQVRAGMGAMPAFGTDRITDHELDVLVEYLLALRSHGQPAE